MKKKILIVEDDETVANIYANRFREEGFEAETLSDGAAALNRIPTYRPNVVLLDLDLPLVHGLEVIKRVRSQPELQSLPLVVFSNAYQHSIIAQAWKAGASMCLIKADSTPTQVVAAVSKAMFEAANSAPRLTLPTPPTVLYQSTHRPNAKADPVFQAEIVKAFARQTHESLMEMRTMWGQFLTCKDPALQISHLRQIQHKVHALTSNAAVAECLQMANMSSAFEALLKELCDRPDNINLSTIRTVGLTVDFLAFLLDWVGRDLPTQVSPPRVLVVDDEFIACRAVESALEIVNIKPAIADRAEDALTLLQENPYDLILLDVDMPGITGFELCSQLRALPAHKNTPVIFVTGMTSFEDRAQSTLSGGNDLIGKPILLIELTVKAVTHLLRHQLQTWYVKHPAKNQTH
ncbi:MAG: response regulator [Verrucomicrobiota bacterium]